MYQLFVVGLCGLALVGCVYFIQNADSGKVVTGRFSTSGGTSAVQDSTPLVDTLPGNYVCNASSGCQNPRILSLFQNGEMKLSASFENGVELLEEFGTWNLGEDGSVQILIRGTNSESYGTPRSLFIGTIHNGTLSGVRYDTTFYPDWKNPEFRKEPL